MRVAPTMAAFVCCLFGPKLSRLEYRSDRLKIVPGSQKRKILLTLTIHHEVKTGGSEWKIFDGDIQSLFRATFDDFGFSPTLVGAY